MENIGSSVFSGCSSLGSMTISSSLGGQDRFYKLFGSSSGVIPSSLVTLVLEGDANIGSYMFSDCSSITSITIPDSITSIGEYAFSNCSSLSSIIIPENVENLGLSVFSGCNSLESMIISRSLGGQDRFYKLFGSSSGVIPSSLVTLVLEGDANIGSYMFSDCSSITSITILHNVTSIGDYAFSNCYSLINITIPGSVENLGLTVFSGCNNLETMTLPGYLAGLDRFYKLFGDRLSVIPSRLVTLILVGSQIIGDYAFAGCTRLTSITIDGSITSIGYEAFYGCTSLTSVIIGNSVRNIGERAFEKCSSLTSVTIGNNVRSIDGRSFYGCSSLTSVTIEATTPPSLSTNLVFGALPSSYKIYVPSVSVDAYKSATSWSEYAYHIYAIEE